MTLSLHSTPNPKFTFPQTSTSSPNSRENHAVVRCYTCWNVPASSELVSPDKDNALYKSSSAGMPCKPTLPIAKNFTPSPILASFGNPASPISAFPQIKMVIPISATCPTTASTWVRRDMPERRMACGTIWWNRWGRRLTIGLTSFLFLNVPHRKCPSFVRGEIVIQNKLGEILLSHFIVVVFK